MYSDFILVLTVVVMMIVLVKLLCFVSLNLFGILFGIIQQKKKTFGFLSNHFVFSSNRINK